MATYQTTYTDAPAKGRPGQVANAETSNRISRTVESAAGIAFGQPAFRGVGDHGCVAGGTLTATAAASAIAGNTGNATITASPAAVSPAKKGTYKLTAITAGAGAVFLMSDPQGLEMGEVTQGVAATIDGIGPFTVTAGGTATAIGDQFMIAVTYTSDAICIGLAILSPAVPAVAVGQTLVDGYPFNYTAALMTRGQMYVTAGGVVNDGDPVSWNPATGRYVTGSGIRITDTYFDTTGVDGSIVEVSMKNRSAQ